MNKYKKYNLDKEIKEIKTNEFQYKTNEKKKRNENS